MFLTPIHEQTPDAEVSLRLLGAADEVLDTGADTGAPEAFAAEVRQYYRDAERFEHVDDEQRPEDRMCV